MNDHKAKSLDLCLSSERAERLGAKCLDREAFILGLLGQEYTVRPSGITLQGQRAPELHETVIVDYLGSAGSHLSLSPWRAYGDFPETSSQEFQLCVEKPITQHNSDFISRSASLLQLFDADAVPSMIGSDLAFTVRALPMVHLHVEMSRENEEFPAETWILFSNNADVFLTTRSLLLLGELFKERLLSLLRIY